MCVQLGGLRGLGQWCGSMEMWGSFPWNSFLGSLGDELCPNTRTSALKPAVLAPNQERRPKIRSYALKRGAVTHNWERCPKTASCTPQK